MNTIVILAISEDTSFGKWRFGLENRIFLFFSFLPFVKIKMRLYTIHVLDIGWGGLFALCNLKIWVWTCVN